VYIFANLIHFPVINVYITLFLLMLTIDGVIVHYFLITAVDIYGGGFECCLFTVFQFALWYLITFHITWHKFPCTARNYDAFTLV
jgi:hypothetical protein